MQGPHPPAVPLCIRRARMHACQSALRAFLQCPPLRPRHLRLRGGVGLWCDALTHSLTCSAAHTATGRGLRHLWLRQPASMQPACALSMTCTCTHTYARVAEKAATAASPLGRVLQGRQRMGRPACTHACLWCVSLAGEVAGGQRGRNAGQMNLAGALRPLFGTFVWDAGPLPLHAMMMMWPRRWCTLCGNHVMRGARRLLSLPPCKSNSVAGVPASQGGIKCMPGSGCG